MGNVTKFFIIPVTVTAVLMLVSTTVDLPPSGFFLALSAAAMIMPVRKLIRG